MSRETFLEDVRIEREYQERKWGNSADDTVNEPNDWVAFINHYATRWFSGGFAPYSAETVEDFRSSMVKVAALACAAVESVDRQIAASGKTFYQRP